MVKGRGPAQTNTRRLQKGVVKGRGPAQTNRRTNTRQLQKQLRARGETLARQACALGVMCGTPSGAFQVRHRPGRMQLCVSIGVGHYDVARAECEAACRCRAMGKQDDPAEFATQTAAVLHELKRLDAIAAFECVVECLKRDRAIVRSSQDFAPQHGDRRIELSGLVQAREIMTAVDTAVLSSPRVPPRASWNLLSAPPLARYSCAVDLRGMLLPDAPLRKYCSA